ncbi:MAG: hypothetical protein H6Q19_1178, partial [Bacteroidetes bacterium]|nr:hypothetical protein [Bacteroidota bacterium]
MKALLSLIVTLSFAVVSFAQNVAINSDGSAP